MPNVIHHAHRPPHVHHGLLWYMLIGLAVMFSLILILSLLPTILAPGTTFSPAAYRETVYIKYLQGEKVAYSNPVALSNAINFYRIGEKVIFNTQIAMQTHNYGEKTATLNIDALNVQDALCQYRMGEKFIQ